MSESTPFSVARLGAPPNEINITHLTGSQLQGEKLLLHEYMQIDMAHTVMLVEKGVLTEDQASHILKLLREIDELGPEDFSVDPRYGSFLLQVERYMVDRIGEDVAGRMHTGRSRNDQSTAVNRLFARDQLLEVADALLGMQDTILRLARAHAGTIMPGYTHLQHAQPTTYGHYLMRHYFTFERDQQRLEGAFARTNLSALGGAAMAGTSWPIDRERTAELLGHEGLVENTYDAGIFTRDYPAENAAVLSILCNNVARVAGDIYLWSTYEFGMVEIDDGLAGTSSIMPQKKNPHSVERIRGIAGLSIGWLSSVLGALRSASSSDLEFLFGGDPTRDMVRSTLTVLEVMRATLDTLILHENVMHQRAGVYWSTASNLADEMVRHADISFRTAHHVVGRLVRNAVAAGFGPNEVTSAMVDQAAQETIGRHLGLDEGVVRTALDAEGFLRTRLTPGSPNPERVLETVAEGERRQGQHGDWLQSKRALVDDARQKLRAEVDRYVGRLSAG